MTTVKDVPPTALIEALAEKLGKMDGINAPEWAAYAKTGVHKEKVPDRQDWWEVRLAAVLRKVYLHGPIGASRMSQLFGGAKNRGAKPDKATSGSENIARNALKQLEAAGLVNNSGSKGRVVTGQGMSLLDNTAHEVAKKLQAEVPELAKY